MTEDNIVVKCKYCGVMLQGREQFIGHMYHNHDMKAESMEKTWSVIIK